MATIEEHQLSEGLSSVEREFLNKAVAPSTRMNYDRYWKSWVEWCLVQSPPVNPLVRDPKSIVRFLLSRQQMKKKSLMVLRAALGSVFNFLDPASTPLAEEKLIRQFFAAKRRTEFVMPRFHDEIWDTDDVVTLLQAWGPSEDLSLEKLQKKVVVLLCLATFWRPRSDIARIMWKDVHRHEDAEGNLQGMTLVARFCKETTGKASKLGVLENWNLCPTRNLFLFKERLLLN